MGLAENERPADAGSEQAAGDSIPGAGQAGAPAEPAETEKPRDLAAELGEVSRERDQFKQMAQRLGADFINYRSRAQAEAAEARRGGARRVAMKVIEALDVFDVALSAKASSGVDANWVEGMKAVHRGLLTALATEGIERLGAAPGEQFDPRRHEALISTPSAVAQVGSVIRELKAGYTHHGDVIRPAQVEVAVQPHAQADAERDGGGEAGHIELDNGAESPADGRTPDQEQ